MKAKDLDKQFNSGKEVLDRFDLKKGKRPNVQRVNVDFPLWMVEALDAESRHRGITRQSLIKVWISDRLERIEQKNSK